ncbi:hypothetical protein PHYBLDRAFT_146822 [Phycomyces blakesleeanus NRRL 1555(-)]|uniref:Uncharacterized protein n=1 Tax=Phycomyces blakesleeanus (strain ATCC 8743b / DSM 1359 / FGSC 10004 / NBRC 33097 / NRRL 1555) TaxID=763407 RepID=A0A162PGN3_PHYB8|nr:hypothetical protein PHYBLDRAFT_146822 [Phycomyces blakesleeanus NRRL 1555(-)]OAD72637.1 hypothetical protein PHYBLDRAFT_146822 [Phycomyces blakesleeanus NRRL 1555(-)]|eukprot:XP_018290677.1 hypothetical protein PHYBLDRAFT_146822 [Phycomyces blakesleeanus NRRL 1555(-)]
MSSIIEQNFDECHCTECIKNDDGYTLVPKRFSHRYSKKASLKDTVRTIVIHESGSVEVHSCQSDLPILDISPMSVGNVSVHSKINGDFNEIDNDYESNENYSNIFDIEVEEVNNELDMFSNSSIPENHVHRFIAVFTVLFAFCYVVTNNLPCSEWFKAENIILVGLALGPKEPKTHNSNVRVPCWRGIRAGFMMVSCNIPAARKTGGFTAHNSTCTCFKCNRHFTCFDTTNKVNFCGVKESEWFHRSCGDNRLHAEEWKSIVTPSEKQYLKIENSVRLSPLHCLGYFD